jgi:hypothetical protein
MANALIEISITLPTLQTGNGWFFDLPGATKSAGSEERLS